MKSEKQSRKGLNLLIAILLFATIDSVTSFGLGLDPISILKLQGRKTLLKLRESGQSNNCSQQFESIVNETSQSDKHLMLQMFIASGKTINDLGNYDQCNAQEELKYTLVTIQSISVSDYSVQMGLCVPRECNAMQLRILDNVYKEAVRITGYIADPNDPQYTFPKEDYYNMFENYKVGFYIMVVILGIIFLLGVIGYFVQTQSIGDKKNSSSMVELVEEDNPEQISIEARKKGWALILYSFSITRNFDEIFFRPHRAIKDKKFEVFNGLRFCMLIWVILGHTYLLGMDLGNATPYLKQEAVDKVLAQLIISADFPVTFFYFMSSFIGMFSLIKQYSKSHNIQDENVCHSLHSCETLSTPKLTRRSIIKLIIARWVRLAIPTYILVLFSMTVFEYLGSGPTFTYNNQNILQISLKNYWWSIILFVQNWVPWDESPGLYWVHYLSNDLQFYIVLMLPSLYLYIQKKRRNTIIFILFLLVLQSISYMTYMTYSHNYSILLSVGSNSNMFNILYRKPFGPAGFYALGIIIAIFYYEFTLAISNRQLRDRKAYRFMMAVGRTRKTSLIAQLSGGFVVVFLIFIRYSSFGYQSVENGQFNLQGRWPEWLNACFNGFAHYIFISGVILMFIPMFIGKLSLLRDIFSSPVFKPLSRITFSAFLIQGLGLLLLLFSQEQSIYFDHKNILFIYFTLCVNCYIFGFFIALFMEYPFRTLARILFNPPKRILRLTSELAKELNTDYDENMVEDLDYKEPDNDPHITSHFRMPTEGAQNEGYLSSNPSIVEGITNGNQSSIKSIIAKKYQARLTKISETYEENLERKGTNMSGKKFD